MRLYDSKWFPTNFQNCNWFFSFDPNGRLLHWNLDAHKSSVGAILLQSFALPWCDAVQRRNGRAFLARKTDERGVPPDVNVNCRPTIRKVNPTRDFQLTFKVKSSQVSRVPSGSRRRGRTPPPFRSTPATDRERSKSGQARTGDSRCGRLP